jgi:hypothetical protein
VTCGGCPKECRYADFKILPGRRGKGVYSYAFEMLMDGKDGDPESYTYKRRGRVLGSLHQMKLEAWQQFTMACKTEKGLL